MNYTNRFVVEPGAKVKLHKVDPGTIDPDLSESGIECPQVPGHSGQLG
jgi:hypothetical protein